jgi:hypothetical protein
MSYTCKINDSTDNSDSSEKILAMIECMANCYFAKPHDML